VGGGWERENDGNEEEHGPGLPRRGVRGGRVRVDRYRRSTLPAQAAAMTSPTSIVRPARVHFTAYIAVDRTLAARERVSRGPGARGRACWPGLP
jgi:hypothetical protein